MKPNYWQKACAHLSSADPTLKLIIDNYRGEFLISRGQAYETLLRSIVGQQISVKAAHSIWQRLADKFELKPEVLRKAQIKALRACGLSERKAEYVKDLSQKFFDGSLEINRWPQMSDEEIIEHLIQVRGVGRWTAEMFLMFHLLRPNIFPKADLGIQNAISKAYKKRKPLSDRTLEAFRKKYAPYNTVACWYLWRSLDPIPTEY